MYYHASRTPGIRQLEPRISNHNMPLIYFSKKRENVLVYLSNAVEKYCKEQGFAYDGPWSKWGPYGFEKDGRLRFEELLRAEREGLITILRHKDLSPQKKEWIRKTMRQEYADAKDHPEYQFFLRGTFPELFE
ncbi:MAG: hypothetical protein II477_00380 [Lachnospiraceae bacterium]|nr:hypothetical protein [Lachnospiraceae bacterium]